MPRYSVALALCALAPLVAQDSPFGKPASTPAPVAPAQPAPAPQPAPAAPAAGTAGNYSSSTVENSQDKLFDTKSDSIDLEAGTVNWKGRTLNLGDIRLMRARFERYLASPPPASGFEEYARIIEEVEKLVSSSTFTQGEKERAKNNQRAWELLFKAGESEYDGGASLTLANQVMKAWRQRNELNNYRITVEELKRLNKHEADIIANRADAIARRNSGSGSLNTSGSKPSVSVKADPNASGTRELASLEMQHAETKSEATSTAAAADLLAVKTKLEFQSTIVGFIAARRYHHAIIASAFYRHIYKASHQEVKVGSKQLKELFPLSDFVPTMETLDSLAREAVNDVKVGLGTFEALEKEGDRFAAYERLQETYFLGEFEPALIRVPYAKKRTYAMLARDLRDLQKFGDERDLGAAEEALARISAVAADFPAARIRSKINAARQASDAAVIAAKHAAMQNGPDAGDKVKAELATAAKFWPTNPAIRGFLDEVTKRADLVSQRMPEFDKLYSAGAYRELFNRKEEFALALMQDRPRLDKLNSVLQRVARTDMLLASAETFASRGDRAMAWDLTTEVAATDPTDPKLLQLRGTLAAQVADYAKLLADGERHEKSGNHAAALTAYLAAQEMNRPSKVCQDAIARVGKALMESGVSK